MSDHKTHLSALEGNRDPLSEYIYTDTPPNKLMDPSLQVSSYFCIGKVHFSEKAKLKCTSIHTHIVEGEDAGKRMLPHEFNAT